MIKKWNEYIRERHSDIDSLGDVNSTLLLFKDKDLNDLKLWLEYNGLTYFKDIFNLVEQIKKEFGMLPNKIRRFNNQERLCVAQYDGGFQNRIEIIFKEDEFIVYEFHVWWDGKKMHHDLKSKASFDNVTEIIDHLKYKTR